MFDGAIRKNPHRRRVPASTPRRRTAQVIAAAGQHGGCFIGPSVLGPGGQMGVHGIEGRWRVDGWSVSARTKYVYEQSLRRLLSRL